MIKNLKLERPIAFIDTETTGTHPHSDRIIELSIYKIQPDGSKIAFVSDRDGNYDIFVMDADGSNPTNLTNSPADDVMPAWSP